MMCEYIYDLQYFPFADSDSLVSYILDYISIFIVLKKMIQSNRLYTTISHHHNTKKENKNKEEEEINASNALQGRIEAEEHRGPSWACQPALPLHGCR